jgi:aminoglycoside phosphotransferase (APT) family kinase protein
MNNREPARSGPRAGLSAEIDWGSTGTGDPAYDISVAWKLFSPSAREVFRSEIDVDDAA